MAQGVRRTPCAFPGFGLTPYRILSASPRKNDCGSDVMVTAGREQNGTVRWPKPHIRSYRTNDEAAVLALWRRAGIDRRWLDLRAEIGEKRKRDRSLFLVAESSHAVVGAVMGAYDGRRGWVYHLAVEPERQRQGVGRLLMLALEQRMHRRGVTKINLQVRHDNLEVCAFYERLGYLDEHLVSFGKRIST